MNLKAHKGKIISGIIACLIVALFSFLPYLLRPAIALAIHSNGFPKAHVGKVSFMTDGIYIDKIDLDPNGFSTVEDIQVSGPWPDLIFKRTADKVSIKNISISGEVDDQNRLTIAGWDGTTGVGKSSPSPLPFNSLFIDSLIVDMDTAAGAIRLQSRINLDRKNGDQSVTASISGNQQQLTTNINLNGTFDTSGDFTGKADILDTSIDMGSFTLSRLSGWIDIRSFKKLIFGGQIMAGGMKYLNTPFEDSNLTFDTSQNSSVIFKTKAIGRDLTIDAQMAPAPALNVIISASSMANIISLGTKEQNPAIVDWLGQTGPVQVSVISKDSFLGKPTFPLAANILFKKNNMNFATTLMIEPTQKKISGIISPIYYNCQNIADILPLKDKIGFDMQAGKIGIGGSYIIDFSKATPIVSGPLTLSLSNVDGNIFDYGFKSSNANLQFATLYPFGTYAKQQLTFKTLDTGKVFENGSLTFDANAQTLTVYSAQASLGGGMASFDPFKWNMDAKENNLTVQLKALNLNALIAKDDGSVTADGTISGTVPLKIQGKDVIITNGIIKNDQPGSFKYAPDKMPAALQGDDPRLKTARLALGDYHYDSLQINLDGNLNGNLKTALAAKGHSPVFENREVDLNLNLEGALSAALRQALQPGALAGKLQNKLNRISR